MAKEENLDLYNQLITIFSEIQPSNYKDESYLEDFNIMLKSLKNFQGIIQKLNKKA